MWGILALGALALAWPAWCALRALQDMDERHRQAAHGRPLTPHEARLIADARYAERWSSRPVPEAHNPYGYRSISPRK